MPIEKRSFFSGMNGDISPRLLDDKSSLNIMNARQGSSVFGRNGRLENVPGSTQINVANLYGGYGENQTIGSVYDARRNRFIWANYNTFSAHGIFAYDFVSGAVYAILYDWQVIGGLDFDKSYRIDRNMKVIGDLLYWTDNLNRQRKINIERGIRTNDVTYVTDEEPYTTPMNQEVISLLKRPPMLPPNWEKVTQTFPVLENNFIDEFAGQFAARYYYMDGETSVVSVYSELAPYNDSDDTFNAITVTFDPNEVIDQDVQRVDLIVRYGETNDFSVINSWNKDIPADALAIQNHNDGTQVLTYNFYNDKRGEALDYNGYVFKPFDSVPILSKTLEIAKNRLFLGNNVIGYDTPISTSLTATFNTQTEGATMTAIWYDVKYTACGSFGTAHAGVHVTGTGAFDGYYDVPTAGLWFTTPVDYVTDMVFIGNSLGAVYTYYGAGCTIFGFPQYGVVTDYPSIIAGITNAPSSVSLNGLNCFKTDASYQLGIVFHDFGDRKSGVLTSDSQIYHTADRVYNAISFATGLQWTLDNTLALNEIPEWATQYSIVITKCLRTRFFLQARVKNLTYATKDSDGLYVFNTDTYAITNNGVAIDITLLNGYGMGYTFAEGDLVKIWTGIGSSLVVTTLAIIAQDGNWIVCELQDMGTIGNTASPMTDALFEIYTPYREFVNEPFYEVAQTYNVVAPGTSSRQYSTLGGIIGGDIYILQRTDGAADTYFTENMSPNDKFYLNWYTDAGRTNFVVPIGQVHETNTISFSNTYIIGSRLNGLSSFDPLSENDVPLENGTIQKLQLTSKVQNEQGVVMLCICEKETVSIYLGEVQQYGSNQQTTLTISQQVIGTINALKGSRGTSNPETVVWYNGLVNWLDISNGKAVQYSPNGLEDISRYGQERFFKRFCDGYLRASTGNLDNINGFHHIPSCFDPFHKEWVITLPALIYTNYAEVLPSYGGVIPSYATSILDRFDIFDSLGKTMAFQFENNIWGSDYEWMPEWYEYGSDMLVAFKNGVPYTMYTNTTNWNTVFGTQYPVRFCLTGNINPSALKVLNNITLESNSAPNFTVALSDYPNTQITDLTESDYTDQEGLFYADFFKDRLSPNASGTADERLYSGDDLTDIVIKVMCEFQIYDRLFYCNFVNIGYSYSRGQKQILNPINQ